MAQLLLLDAVLGAATLSLRYNAILFTQFHPIGYIYLKQIYASVVVYSLGLVIRFISVRRGRGSFNRQHVVPSLLLGHINPGQPVLSLISLSINALCLLSVWDFVYRGQLLHQAHDLSFARVGYVDETSARVNIRAPSVPNVPVMLTLSLPSAPDTAVETQVKRASSETDYTATFIFTNLQADTEYQYFTNASHSGTFRTSPENPKHWSLVSTSCMTPFYPYRPWDHALRIPGLEYLDQQLATEPIDLVLFLGDFIYIDLPVAHGWTQEHYTTAYRQVYASKSWTPRLRSLPWIHAYDDHEIINDWASNETGLYSSAMKPFWDYQGHANPTSPFGHNKTHYVFHRGDISFFMLDTRRYRSANTLEDGPAKTMLGAAQLADLEHWLNTERRWKVVVSSVPFTRNWRGPDSADSWAGYLWERDRILDRMKQTDGVIILSGDRHEHATTLFPAKGGKDVIEFSTSPLNQFYEPFSRFHKQIEDTDISIYSHVQGNTKLGVVTFDTRDPNHLQVLYKLVVNGQQVWSYNWTYHK